MSASNNLEIVMKEIKSIKTEINDLKKSIEFNWIEYFIYR